MSYYLIRIFAASNLVEYLKQQFSNLSSEKYKIPDSLNFNEISVDICR